MKKKCLHCTNKAQSRGVCWACSRDVLGAIESGKYTEAQAIDLKMILPRSKPGRKPSSGFALKLSKIEKRSTKVRR